MYMKVLFLALISIALGAPPTNSKFNRRANYKIIGGIPANIADFPWQVSITTGTHPEFGFDCGGFLIAPNWVVTAGQCIYFAVSGSEFLVRAGSNYTNSGGEVYAVSETVLHSGFNEFTAINDIGLLKLSTPVNTSYASAVQLPGARQSVPDNASLIVTGYGSTALFGDPSEGLLQVTVPTVNHDTCRDAFAQNTPQTSVTDNMFCAGTLGEDGKSACTGDSGGAAVLDGKAVGIASWSYMCGTTGLPNVYTQVSNYIDWINQYVQV